jgi:phosphoribosylformylglycinamidine synthase
MKRVYVEKRAGFDVEARRLKAELTGFLGGQYPELAQVKGLRLLRRYDTAYLDDAQFEAAVGSVFSEPQCDRVFFCVEPPAGRKDRYFGIEYAPGQYDQRADSAEQCAELVTGVRPAVRTADIYIFESSGEPLSGAALEAVKRYLINPVDSREASMDMPESLEEPETPAGDIPILEGFRRKDANPEEWEKLAAEYSLAMSSEDLLFCQAYFSSLGRDPTLAELRILDTYWSDHCRHTTFTTVLEDISLDQAGDDASRRALRKALDLYEDARQELYAAAGKKPERTLMDIATIGAKVLKKRGLLADLDESGEINACTVRIRAEFGGPGEPVSGEPWLLLFKNETHNHPTEIEPFGGAATCLGGAIRDPLSGRAYVYQAMRITGGGDPRAGLAETLPGKLPQIKIAREAAAGYSSYGNQIGLATGQVAEFYHPGFIAKRMELGGVIGAAPEAWVCREEPVPGDVVILVGGKTGRDGIGGATGSSKMHTGESVETAGAEVQKGNAVEERKLQRLFRNPQVSLLIKRCNDFGAGGVSVAVGELAAGLDINLDEVPKKYAGLDGTELAISESQERMAVVTAPEDAETFIRRAAAENLDACIIARVTAGDQDLPWDAETEGDSGPRLRMTWRGKTLADLSRRFLNSHGAPRSALVKIKARYGPASPADQGGCGFSGEDGKALPGAAILDNLERELASLRTGSRRGLTERFDGSIGAASVLFPWGGREQGTPECGMAALLPSMDKQSRTASLMTFGYDPVLMAESPYEGAKGAVREALAKFACLGANPWEARLSLQEYFERPENPESWGKPAAALLGALEAQIRLEVPAIGGKDSMSGNYRDKPRNIDIAVPPTLAAFAAGTAKAEQVRSGVLSGVPGNSILLFSQSSGLDRPSKAGDEWENFKANMNAIAALAAAGLIRSAYPVGAGGVAAALAITAFGNMTGVEANAAAFALTDEKNYQGSVLVEIDGSFPGGDKQGVIEKILASGGLWAVAGRTLGEPVFRVVQSAGNPVSGRESPPAGDRENQAAELPLRVLKRAFERPLVEVYPQTSTGAAAAENPGGGPEAEGASGAQGPSGIRDKDSPEPDVLVPGLEAALYSCRGINTPLLCGGVVDSRENSKARAGFTLKGRAAPLAVLPVFPGTNCEWDMERAFREAGANTRLVIFRNRNREDIRDSIRELAEAIKEAQILALSGGFSAGDEPDGSGKFIANVLRAPAVAEALTELLGKRDGLALGICNGFQALIKLGLVPYGVYKNADDTMPALTFNALGRHVSRMVRTRVMPNCSPWFTLEEPGAVHIIPVSHGEGRVVVRKDEAGALFKAGQIPCCYADAQGRPTLTEPDNPNGSDFAIEALTSPDGRILGKMGHSERRGEYVHINIPGNKRQRIFEAGTAYFQ